MSGLFIFRGGPFGGLEVPKGSVIVSDKHLMDQAEAHGCTHYEVLYAPFLVIELGLVQAKSALAHGALFECLYARLDSLWYSRPVALLMHDSSRFVWSGSKSQQLEALIRDHNPVYEWHRGDAHIQHTRLGGFVAEQAIDDGSEPDMDDEQPNYRDREYAEEDEPNSIDEQEREAS